MGPQIDSKKAETQRAGTKGLTNGNTTGPIMKRDISSYTLIKHLAVVSRNMQLVRAWGGQHVGMKLRMEAKRW